MGLFCSHSIIYLILTIFLNVVFCDVSNNRIEKNECNLPKDLVNEIRSYTPIVNKIINTLTKGKFKGRTYDELATFVDRFGSRQAGTENLENSIDYMMEKLNSYNLDNVHGEEVTVPHWVRGLEEAEMLEPRRAKVPILALGSSVGTPEEGIEAEVLVVRSFEELAQRSISGTVKGKIIVYNQDYQWYGQCVKYRTQGASMAAKYGGVAALIKSVTPFSLSTLHTGQQDYSGGVPKVPAVSITLEDARMFQRMQDRGKKIVIRLNITTENLPSQKSRNTIAELKGTKLPEKVVLVSGHLDSWDVGVGAMDDGGGAFISWSALALLKELGLRSRRTIRSVLWTGEEPGLIGAFAYNVTHFSELENHTLMIESDEGVFTPYGIQYTAGHQAGCILEEVMKLLAPINATAAERLDSVGSDIAIWTGVVPTIMMKTANEKYFWFHHSSADTMDVLNSDDMDKATAVFATVAYVIADLSVEFPRHFD